MPVILPVLADPGEVLVQAETLRKEAIAWLVYGGWPSFAGPEAALSTSPRGIIAGALSYSPRVGAEPVPPRAILQDRFGGTMLQANAGVASPCGAWTPLLPAGIVLPLFSQATERWGWSGVTRNATGSPLGLCAVKVFETGRLYVDGAPVVAETISDGGGAYAVEVPLNTAYQANAYLPGSPDVFASSPNNWTPGQL